MKEILIRMYGCTIIKYQENNTVLVKSSTNKIIHCNLLPAILAIETESAFIVFYEQTANFSLREYVKYY